MSDIVATILGDVANTDTLTTMAMGDIGQATEQIRANNQATQDSYNNSAARSASVQAATKTITEAKAAGDLTLQTALQNYAHNLGVDPDGNLSAQQSDAQATFLDASARASQAAATIAQKRSVSFVDDPLQWLSNKLTINDDINTFNGAATEANTAEQFIQSSNQLIDARAVALANIKTVTNQAAAEAQVTNAVAAVQEQAEIVRRQGIAANTAGIEAIQNMSYKNIQYMALKTNADNTVFQIQNEQERMRIANEQLGLEEQRLALQKANEQDRNGANQYLVAQLKKGLQQMYPNNPNKWNIPDGKFQAYITGKTPLDPEWKTAFEVAQNTDAQGNRVLGTSPSSALETLSFKPVVGPGAQPTVALLQNTANAVMQTPQYKQLVASKDVAGAKAMIDDAVNKAVVGQSQHTDSPTSLYYLPPADKLPEMIPALQEGQLYQTVIAPAAKAGVDLSTPDQVAGMALQAVRDGKISLNDAAQGIAEMYKAGQVANFAAKQVVSLGIAAAPTYIAPARSSGFIRGPIDWTDPIAVKENFMRRSNELEAGFSMPANVGRIGGTR